MRATTSEQFAISDLQKIEDNRVTWNFMGRLLMIKCTSKQERGSHKISDFMIDPVHG